MTRTYSGSGPRIPFNWQRIAAIRHRFINRGGAQGGGNQGGGTQGGLQNGFNGFLNNLELNEIEAAMSKSPTGAKLLSEAQQDGVKISIVSNLGPDILGLTEGNNVSIKQGTLAQMVTTLGHELVHATTPNDGDSKMEEAVATKVGEQVAREAGLSTVNDSLDTLLSNVYQIPYYQSLPDDNNIINDLANNGINLIA